MFFNGFNLHVHGVSFSSILSSTHWVGGGFLSRLPFFSFVFSCVMACTDVCEVMDIRKSGSVGKAS